MILVEALVDVGDLVAERAEALGKRELRREPSRRAEVDQADDHLAPIVRVGAAFDESGCLESIDRPGCRPRRDPHPPRQLAGGDRTRPIEQVEALPIGGVETGEAGGGASVQGPE